MKRAPDAGARTGGEGGRNANGRRRRSDRRSDRRIDTLARQPAYRWAARAPVNALALPDPGGLTPYPRLLQCQESDVIRWERINPPPGAPDENDGAAGIVFAMSTAARCLPRVVITVPAAHSRWERDPGACARWARWLTTGEGRSASSSAPLFPPAPDRPAPRLKTRSARTGTPPTDRTARRLARCRRGSTRCSAASAGWSSRRAGR